MGWVLMGVLGHGQDLNCPSIQDYRSLVANFNPRIDSCAVIYGEEKVYMAYEDCVLNKNLNLTYGAEFRSLPLMSSYSPMIVECLEALHGVLCKALQHNRRVFAFRFDLHLPAYIAANGEDFRDSVVSRFIASLKAKIRCNRESLASKGGQVHDTEVRYFWVREVGGNAGRVHYHFVVLLNGDAFNWLGNYDSSRPNTVNRVREAWASALGAPVDIAKPLVQFPESPSYTFCRDDPDSVRAFFYRASYLCKERTKQYGNGHHGYGASRR